MRKVFLDSLPRKQGIGALKDKLVIDWINSVGYKVKFKYDDIEGEIEILSCNKNNIKIKYKNKEFYIRRDEFRKCRIGRIIGTFSSDFKIGILNSRLNAIFDLSNIDWDYVFIKTLSSKLKETCELKKNNPNLTTIQICETMNIVNSTVYKWLKIGEKLNLC